MSPKSVISVSTRTDNSDVIRIVAKPWTHIHNGVKDSSWNTIGPNHNATNHSLTILGDTILAHQKIRYKVIITLVNAKGTRKIYKDFCIAMSCGRRIEMVDFLYKRIRRSIYINNIIVACPLEKNPAQVVVDIPANVVSVSEFKYNTNDFIPSLAAKHIVHNI